MNRYLTIWSTTAKNSVNCVSVPTLSNWEAYTWLLC